VVFLGVLITKRLIATRPKIKKTRPAEVTPLVKVKKVHLSEMRLSINTQGTVRTSKKIDLVPQVSGIVLKVSPGLVKGGRFKKDELLIKIDDADYIAALKKAKAELKAQEAKLSRLREESEQAEAEWKEANPETEPPPLLLKIPDIRATEAALQAARAAIQQAELNLSRTEIRAPFSGVTLNENIDEGQFIRAGQPVATLFSDDAVEITVNLTEKEAGYIDIPGFNTSSKEGSPSVVSAEIGSKIYRWNGTVVRAEPVDEKTRTIPVVIRVENPYRSLPPLSVGLFTDVKIKGKLIKAATLIDKTAIHFDEKGKTYVWLLNRENRLKKQYVRVIQSTDGQYMITGGISDGARIVLRAPSQAVEGMKVKVD
jgi:RND family efflux transporter MFP subunit